MGPCLPGPGRTSDRALQDQAPTDNLGSLQREITTAVQHLREHGVVALPTDTLYGLALTMMVANWDQLDRVTQEIPKLALRLAHMFWPGPLTLIVPKAAWMPDVITGGRATVSPRMPDHPVPLGLATELGRPIAGASFGGLGQPELRTLEAVIAEVGHRVSYVVRGGPAPKGLSSTVVDVTTNKPRLLRSGALPYQQVLQAARGR
ncbi:MAG: Sua5/YciO/YrdC/YwlC family protein [Dehalococcoidia bacterium]|nr:Sua5/YciO/YrdC/YwlC family protein [Dehalococcoidia bacterium]MSQ17050.1 Sua5/YciO/YrdC/YwlC family protein [Dehalococcoidia bacterium]